MNSQPLVMCLTNTVAANFTANVLLAIGAKPAMVEEVSEAEELAACADAVLINVGTVTPLQAAVQRAAIRVCRERHVPWVLDPVAVQVLSFRRGIVGEFLDLAPTLVRANSAEIAALLREHPALGRSVPYLETAAVDRVVDGGETVEISGGVPMLQDVTATGCAQGAVAAAFLGQGQSAHEACISASRLMKQAGERAFARAGRPGAFQSALLDELYALSPLRRASDD